MTVPLVSVIVPCYRQGRFLAQAVNSALGQSHPAIEVIVADDGSDDDTGDVARTFGERVRYLRRDNGGPAAARNTGIAAASGKYLLFLDADDVLHPEAVAWLVAAADERENVLCVCGFRFFERGDDLEAGREVYPPHESSAANILVENCCPPLTFLCSRAAVWDPLESTCRHASLSIL